MVYSWLYEQRKRLVKLISIYTAFDTSQFESCSTFTRDRDVHRKGMGADLLKLKITS